MQPTAQNHLSLVDPAASAANTIARMYSRPSFPVPAPPQPSSAADQILPPISNNPAANMYQYPSHGQQASQQHQPRTEAPKAPLQSFEGGRGDYRYSLIVEQQPIRARMCGFGDKDRRPITPPPCIRLVVIDRKTEKEVNYHELDGSFYVLTVDLYDAEGAHEVNLVRHATGGPSVSISNATPTSYNPPADTRQPMYFQDGYGRTVQAVQATSPSSYNQIQHQMVPGYYQNAAAPPPSYPSAVPAPGYPPAPHPAYPAYAGQPQYPTNPMPMAVPVPAHTSSSATGMFTRNLIGSLTVNASKLNDNHKKLGLWFVLQDLSVRTEGTFRLKMNFVDVGGPQGTGTLNKGRAPVLATCFSDVFQVFSAKKFPGVIESTPLSKAFASQGIKIPIRKDVPKQLANQKEYDED